MLRHPAAQRMLQPEQGTFSSGGSLLQLPVLNLGLPMAASTQLADFFHCGGSTGILKASHYECENEAAGETELCGHCVRRNLEVDLPWG